MATKSETYFLTGVSSGIGLAMAETLVNKGYQVVGTVRSKADKDLIEAKLNSRFKALVLDINDYPAVNQLPERLKSEFGIKSLSGLINNAGIALAAPFMDQDFSEVELILKTNVLSLMKITQVLTPMLIPKDENLKSKIINISSISGQSAAPFLSIYAASKHAVEGFSEALRKEYNALGIDIIVVGPGSIQTPIWQKGFVMIKEKYNHSFFAVPFHKFIKIALHEQEFALPVSEVSDLILEIVNAKSPSFRYAPIPRKWQNWYLPMLIPSKIYFRLTIKALGLERKPFI